MIDIVSVRFKSGGKQYYFDPNGIEVKSGEDVIVETSRGAEYGECVWGKSITDPCLGWEKTERLIFDLADLL